VTTGLPTIDYYLSSDLMEPDGAQRHYSEKLIRLPNLALAFPQPVLPSPLKTRADFGLQEDDFLFYTSQSLFKYLPQFDEIYPRIAREVDHAKFIFIANSSQLVTTQFRQRLQRCFARYGLDAEECCRFHPRLDYADFLNLNHVCDVLLDTLAWSGGKTTLEAIGCGLPVVTLPGRFMRGRHAFAMFKMVGVEETIAASVDDYVAIAVRLASDHQFLRSTKERMAARLDRLYDDGDCIRRLDGFYVNVVNTALTDSSSTA
jgi:predicted O-linked N-acetylglucosamine transferase (SPINDLY family)